VPVVDVPATTADIAERLSSAALALVAHEGALAPLSDVVVPASGEVIVVVGPEGGLTDEELSDFEKAGASAYRLGPSVLRTSTAGVVAASVLLSRTDRWRVVE
jgi:16S rRNA (uracil1498-N3)-methyltransferase